jgi:crotonobetainyl-CoA:carnitine CoA-transferase CaiB-like acyl-CoA transferase
MGSLLQTLGATVLKIEQPIVGDAARNLSRWGFLNYNFGKKSVALNLKTKEGREVLHRLVERADIFLENLGPDVGERLGFSYPALKKVNPHLIYCSIKGFSRESKHYSKPAFDAVAQAMSGTMSLTGEPGGAPLRVGNPSIDLGAAAYGTTQVLAALLERRRSRRGRYFEISLFDMSVYWNGYWLTYYGLTGDLPQRLGSGHLAYCPHKVFETKDKRQVFIATLSDDQWRKLSDILQLSLGEPFDRMQYRLTHRAEVETSVGLVVSRLDLSDVLDKLDKRVPCAPVNSIADIYDDEELNRRQVLIPIQHNGRKTKIVRPPISENVREGDGTEKYREIKGRYLSPALGKDTVAVLKSLNYGETQIKSFRQKGII